MTRVPFSPSKSFTRGYAVPILLVAGLAGILLWIFMPTLAEHALTHNCLSDSQLQRIAQFGDAFGWINSLFSGLALIGIIATLLLQRADIALQHRELEETQDIMQRQQQVLDKQQFESTLFNLLHLLRETRDGIHGTGNSRNGITAIKHLLMDIVSEVQKSKQTPEQTISRYSKAYDLHYDGLAPYFRLVYLCLRMIDERYHADALAWRVDDPTAISVSGDAKSYARILRAQLSPAELSLIFLNAESLHGVQKLKPLTERYNLFDNLRCDHLVNPGMRNRSRSQFHDDASNVDPATIKPRNWIT